MEEVDAALALLFNMPLKRIGKVVEVGLTVTLSPGFNALSLIEDGPRIKLKVAYIEVMAALMFLNILEFLYKIKRVTSD